MAKQERVPKMMPLEKRVISSEVIPAGEKTCNARLGSRDGYCASPGVTAFNRCAVHGGKKALNSMDLFKGSLGVQDAAKLQVLLEDTLSMDNELASAKTMLLASIEQYQRATHVIAEYMKYQPERPKPGADDVEIETYSDAVQLHGEVLEMASKLQKQAYNQSHGLIRTLTVGVHRNSKIKEGSKFTLDAKQIASILKVQLNVMKVNCAQCPKLRTVLQGIQDGTRDIPINTNLSESNRKAMGLRAYKDMVKNVNDIGEEVYSDEEV